MPDNDQTQPLSEPEPEPEPDLREVAEALLKELRHAENQIHARINAIEQRLRRIEAPREAEFKAELDRRLQLDGPQKAYYGEATGQCEVGSASPQSVLEKLLRRKDVTRALR